MGTKRGKEEKEKIRKEEREEGLFMWFVKREMWKIKEKEAEPLEM